MKGLFNIDNPVMRFITKVGYLWWLDILFVVTSLPVFTIGVSITALNYACMKLLDDEGSVTGNYFKSWKENFKAGNRLRLDLSCLCGICLLLPWSSTTAWIRVNEAHVGMRYCHRHPVLISLCWVFAIQSKFVHP
jgi:hypothetical protein